MHKLPNVPMWVAGTRPTSLVDGFGINYTLFLQGCSHQPKCKGCHNASTHKAHTVMPTDTDLVFKMIRSQKLITGVTFSGGEPLDQYEAVAVLAKRFKALGYQTTLYTGYEIDKPECAYNLSMFDYVVDGRYVEELRDLTCTMKGSTNQRILQASKNFPGLFKQYNSDLSQGKPIRQYIYADLDIPEECVIW